MAISLLHYSNALLTGHLSWAVKPLQMVQKVAGCLVFNQLKRPHFYTVFIEPHWLPLAACVKFNAIAYKAFRGALQHKTVTCCVCNMIGLYDRPRRHQCFFFFSCPVVRCNLHLSCFVAAPKQTVMDVQSSRRWPTALVAGYASTVAVGSTSPVERFF